MPKGVAVFFACKSDGNEKALEIRRIRAGRWGYSAEAPAGGFEGMQRQWPS